MENPPQLELKKKILEYVSLAATLLKDPDNQETKDRMQDIRTYLGMSHDDIIENSAGILK